MHTVSVCDISQYRCIPGRPNKKSATGTLFPIQTRSATNVETVSFVSPTADRVFIAAFAISYIRSSLTALAQHGIREQSRPSVDKMFLNL